MMLFIYQICLVISFPFIIAYLALRYRKRFFLYVFKGIQERLGIITIDEKLLQKKIVWLHAASIGEMRLLKPLINELRTHYLNSTFVLSTLTPEAYELAKELRYADINIFLPLDIYPCVHRVVRALKPSLILLVESEIWPQFIVESKKNGAIIGLINARISDAAFPVMKLMKKWYQHIFAHIDFFGARDKEDKERILFFGVEKDRVLLTGNIKYDGVNIPLLLPEEMERIYQSFHIQRKDLVMTCGSIHADELQPLVDAYMRLKEKYPLLKLILAPRHIDRIGGMLQYLVQRGVSYRLFSSSGATSESSCVILDTYGNLISAYRIATVVFVGGSLEEHQQRQ